MDDLVLFPAIDLVNGQAVQLRQGLVDSAQLFGDPIEAAHRWAEEGATWLHVVDLDAAFGRGNNAKIAARIVAETSLQVELAGGIRDDAALRRALDTGCTRVNIGTAAIESPQWASECLAAFGERIAIAIDVKGGRLAGHGWTTNTGDILATITQMSAAGARRFVVTDVNSDGMLAGPNLKLLEAVCGITDAKIVASGGVTSFEDIAALRELTPLGVEGAIIGTALYVGQLNLQAALRVAAGQPIQEA